MFETLSCLEMLRLQIGAAVMLTDSGSIQKEAYPHGVIHLSLRDEIEWVETVSAGLNQMVGTDNKRIVTAWRGASAPQDKRQYLFGETATHQGASCSPLPDMQTE